MGVTYSATLLTDMPHMENDKVDVMQQDGPVARGADEVDEDLM